MNIKRLLSVILSTAILISSLAGCNKENGAPLSDPSDSSGISYSSSDSTPPKDASETSDNFAPPEPAESETTTTEHQHQYSVIDSAEANCLEAGYETYECPCGDRYTETTDEALGHKYSEEVISPTCYDGGYTTYICSRCGDTYNDVHTSALGHDYSLTQTVESTCTQNGHTTYTCSRCGDSYTSEITYAQGHSWGDWVVTKNPTVTSEGVMESRCIRCGEVQTMSIDKLIDVVAYAAEVVTLVNAERTAHGLPPLASVTTLSEYAQLRSMEIVNNFEHIRPDGSSPTDYVFILGEGYTAAGENIAAGQRTPEEVMNAWMNSPGHRANILEPYFTKIGVGCYEYNRRLYWTQIFAG